MGRAKNLSAPRYVGLHGKVRNFLSNFNQIPRHATHFPKKISSIKFHENPSSGSRAYTDGQTDMTKLIRALLRLRELALKTAETGLTSS